IAFSTSGALSLKLAGDQLSNLCERSRTAASLRASTSARIASTVSRTLASAALIALASIPRLSQRAMGSSSCRSVDERAQPSMGRCGLVRQHAANAAARVGHVAVIARDEMQMHVHARLPAGAPDIGADVVAVRRELLLDMRLGAVEQRQHRGFLLGG